MAAEVKREVLENVTSLEPETLEELFELVAVELMSVLDHVEERHGLDISADPKLRGADKLLGLYILWKQGDVSLPWLAENLSKAMVRNGCAGSHEEPKKRRERRKDH